MHAFIIKHQSVLVNFWLESTVIDLCKILVVGRTGRTTTIPIVLLLQLLLRVPRYLIIFAVTQFYS